MTGFLPVNDLIALNEPKARAVHNSIITRSVPYVRHMVLWRMADDVMDGLPNPGGETREQLLDKAWSEVIPDDAPSAPAAEHAVHPEHEVNPERVEPKAAPEPAEGTPDEPRPQAKKRKLTESVHAPSAAEIDEVLGSPKAEDASTPDASTHKESVPASQATDLDIEAISDKQTGNFKRLKAITYEFKAERDAARNELAALKAKLTPVAQEFGTAAGIPPLPIVNPDAGNFGLMASEVYPCVAGCCVDEGNFWLTASEVYPCCCVDAGEGVEADNAGVSMRRKCMAAEQ